ncbi:MAG: trypsin-like peptidase domain-containing protein [Lachnospiraceae bacterium]|nr:trypsin-like peptidase domain-containing protein [Lachnospiraceae bacterium]
MDSYNSYQTYSQSPVPGNDNTPKKEKKKKGTFKKLLTGALIGLLFGIFAGCGFIAASYAGDRLFGLGLSDAFTQKAQIKEEADAEAYDDEEEQEAKAEKKAVGKDFALGNDKAPVTEGKGPDISTVQSIPTGEGVYDVSEVVKSVMPAVVSVSNSYTAEMQFFGQVYSQEAKSAGSGIIIGKSDTELLIATNDHVVESAEELAVVFTDDESAPAQVKGTDPDRDLAVIAVQLSDIGQDTIDSISIARLGDSDDLVVGEPVIAIGNALGYGQSVTTGVVSALNRPIAASTNESPYGDSEVSKFIQTDAAINPGNSGGALLNMQGEVIGINSNKIGGNAVEGMGYAIPISDAEPIIHKLMNRETKLKVDDEDRGYLGITGVSVEKEYSQVYGMPIGVYISSVNDGSAADKAGLVRGDVITKIDGQRVTTMDELKEEMQYYKVGEKVVLTVMQATPLGYEALDVEVVLGSVDDINS